MAGLDGLGNLPDKLGAAGLAYATYWASLAKTDGVPFKKSFDLGAMLKFAANLVMVERHSPQRFTWRLMGTAVRNLTGVELTGTDAFDFHTEEQRLKALTAYNTQLDTPCGVWGVTILRGASGYEVPAEVLVLPLRGDDGSLRFLANTVEPYAERSRLDPKAAVEMKLLSWPEHRFLDIGFGLPKLPRKSR